MITPKRHTMTAGEIWRSPYGALFLILETATMPESVRVLILDSSSEWVGRELVYHDWMFFHDRVA